jgi:hypothetical protein
MRERGSDPGTRVRLVGPPEADGEYVGLRVDRGPAEELVHLHDYTRLYAVPGLYEHVVQDLLECRSPQVAAGGLARALELLRLDAARISLLDLGAGTGLAGELASGLGFARVVGLDLLPAAREAALRDRPGVYLDYVIGDLAAPEPELLARLRHHQPGALLGAGALGGTHMPPAALETALTLLPRDAPVVFTIDEHWTHSDEPGGFRTPLARLERSGALRVLERTRFRHRLRMTGEPIHYELFVAAAGRPGGV